MKFHIIIPAAVRIFKTPAKVAAGRKRHATYLPYPFSKLLKSAMLLPTSSPGVTVAADNKEILNAVNKFIEKAAI